MAPRAADNTGSRRRDVRAAGAQRNCDDDPGLYMSARYLRSVVDYVRAKDAPVQPVLEALGMNESELAEPDAFIPHWVQDRVFAAAEQVTGDTNVGLHAGERIHMMNFGIVGQIALCSRS
jgi:hypothetical protein